MRNMLLPLLCLSFSAYGHIYIKQLQEVGLQDLALVGGKNASLGQMIRELTREGIRVPHGFAITTDAYREFIKQNNLQQKIQEELDTLPNYQDIKELKRVGAAIRHAIMQASFSGELESQITKHYHELSQSHDIDDVDVAVRSSATAEDLPDASFAGQQDTYLNVQGIDDLLLNCKKCFASLFTDRAISYRISKGFDHFDVALSVGVQKMVRSDLACSGVAFSLDTETGFESVITIESVYGLGEQLVQGQVSPDEYRVFKTKLNEGYQSIISKKLGSKNQKMIYRSNVMTVGVSKEHAKQFCLTDDEIAELARMVTRIENHYSHVKGSWCPVDVEWAKDGLDSKLYIVQARPETVHSKVQPSTIYQEYHLQAGDRPLVKIIQGQSIGQKIVSGIAHVIHDLHDIEAFKEGEILVTQMTDPDWVPVMKKAAGIVTNLGGRTCHAAIVSRELGVPAIVGTEHATQKIRDGQHITLDCSQGSEGVVYDGAIPFSLKSFDLSTLEKPQTALLVNVADPSRAFAASRTPFTCGVGLARVEFIINNVIKAHPMAFVQPEKVVDSKLARELEELTAGYASKEDFFVEKLAEGVAMIAAAFYPHRIIVRFSDFKSNEYHNLLAGLYFEPEESNPMLGLRGASRYYHESYAPAFELEVQAIKRVRNLMGLDNVSVMIPMVRTLGEADKVIDLMQKGGLIQGERNLDYFMMVEIPSNVILLEEFAKRFNGFSIGSNDLTQFTLAVDRDSALLTKAFDERDLAIQISLKTAVQKARAAGRYIGICGQAPSDFPEIGRMLIAEGISSLSLNPDAVIPFVLEWNNIAH